MNTTTIVQKLWDYCNVLRDDGMSYGECPSTSHRAGSEQLTYALTLALSQRERGLEGVMADERTKAPYNQKSPEPEKYGWPPSPQPSPANGRGCLICDGDELFDHYRHPLEGLRNSTITWLDVTNRSSLPRHMLEALGNQKGLLGLIFNKSQNKFQDPIKLRRLIVLTDRSVCRS